MSLGIKFSSREASAANQGLDVVTPFTACKILSKLCFSWHILSHNHLTLKELLKIECCALRFVLPLTMGIKTRLPNNYPD